MRERDWSILIDSIDMGNCVLVLGPDIATERVNGQEVPLMKILSNQLAEELKHDNDILDTDNLLHIGQRYSLEYPKNELQYMAKMFYEKRHNITSPIHTYLCELPFHLIINASHDDYFISALEHNGKKSFDFHHYNFSSGKNDYIDPGTAERPLIYYLYGSSFDYQSLVLSENDLIDFLVSISSRNPPIPSYITSEFCDRNKTFLFLGFGFKNWYLRILLHILYGEGGNRNSRSFAMEKIENADINFQYSAIFFRDLYKIDIIHDIEWEHFAKELRDRYNAYKSSTTHYERQKTPPAHAPTVFICHASENREYAAGLYKTLQDKGIKPWLDQENIDGGDDWHLTIQSAIAEVDYFIVLQSQALQDKMIGYVNREIHLAIDRSREFRDIKFIIPVKIEECRLLKKLSQWQTIDLTVDKNLSVLVNTIQRDHQRRKKNR